MCSWTDCVLCRFMEIYLPMKQFFHNLIHPEYSAVTDVYVLMFLADTVDFIIIVFGYAAFGVRLISQFSLSSPCRRSDSGTCFPLRNTRQGTSPRPFQRTRFRGLSWSWCWSSLGPWWWTEPSTSGSLSWGRSSFRSSSSLESTSGCSLSCRGSQRSKKTNQVDLNVSRRCRVWTSMITSLCHQLSLLSCSHRQCFKSVLGWPNNTNNHWFPSEWRRWKINCFQLYIPLLTSWPLQAFQWELGRSDVVFRQVYLLWTVGLSDPLRLPHPRFRKLPHQELQLRQPLPVSRVSQTVSRHPALSELDSRLLLLPLLELITNGNKWQINTR